MRILDTFLDSGLDLLGYWLENRHVRRIERASSKASLRRAKKKSERVSGSESMEHEMEESESEATSVNHQKSGGIPRYEAPYISPKRWGQLRFPFTDKRLHKIRDRKGRGLCIEHMYEHKIVFGGSGSGKTYSVLNHDLTEWYRSTHVPRGPEREAKKFFGIVLDPKGDFRDKVWYLGKRYGRIEDTIYFGPGHSTTYDVFGDPTESPQQLANKFLEMLKAFSGGVQSNDPFWDNNARKLGMNIVFLHRGLMEGAKEGLCKQYDRLDFRMLNLIMMDRGRPKNQGAIDASLAELAEMQKHYREACEQMVQYLSTAEASIKRAEKRGFDLQAALNSLERDLGEATDGSVKMEIAGKIEQLRGEMGWIEALVDEAEHEGESQDITTWCSRLRVGVMKELSESDMDAKVDLINTNGPMAVMLATQMSGRSGVVGDAGLSDVIDNLASAIYMYISSRERLIAFRQVEPQYGLLRGMLNDYAEVIKQRGGDPEADLVLTYFNGEFLDVANEKTAGSVGMTATSMVSLFAHHPFDTIFTSDPDGIKLNEIIDKGKILYMDIPASESKTGEVALLAMKMDFFRKTLMRKRLKNEAGELVNQERPGLYFCDEFGTVATPGQSTGEAGYLDKVREFKVGCVLGSQSFPVLLGRLPENELYSILSNCGSKVFLANDDAKTNEFAANAMGDEIKVQSHLNQSATEHFLGAEKSQAGHGFSLNYQRQNRFNPSAFALLGKGEAIVRLPRDFSPKSVYKVQYEGCPITDPAPGQGPPIPGNL